jgi:hypothetical protein
MNFKTTKMCKAASNARNVSLHLEYKFLLDLSEKPDRVHTDT